MPWAWRWRRCRPGRGGEELARPFPVRALTFLRASSACSGGGTVDFQEFVKGLSAFSNQGSREEKLKCEWPCARDQILDNHLCRCAKRASSLTPQSHSRSMTWIEMGLFPTESCSSCSR